MNREQGPRFVGMRPAAIAASRLRLGRHNDTQASQ